MYIGTCATTAQKSRHVLSRESTGVLAVPPPASRDPCSAAGFAGSRDAMLAMRAAMLSDLALRFFCSAG